MKKSSGLSTAIAIAIGLSCAFAIWYLQPINNFLLKNSKVADNYLPELGVLLVIMLTLVINPLLRWQVPKFALSGKQLAIVFGIILVACSSAAIMQSWPHSLAFSNEQIAKDKALSEIHDKMDLPESLYVEAVGYEDETPVSSQLVDELDEGASIPWSAWIAPAFSWGTMIAFCLLLMVGLALIVYPQWRDNERLPFPLLAVQQSLIETPENGKLLPPLFRSPVFWIGFIIVAVIYMFQGLHHHTGQAFPGFGLGWGLWFLEQLGIWRHLDWWVKSGRVIFIIIGITYFVPNRVAFSIWATVLIYQLYRMIGYEYFAPFHGGAAIHDHRNGAVLGVAMVIIWLGRTQWAAVAKAMFRPAKDDVDRRNRVAGLIFCIGCLGLLIWQVWAGNSIFYAILAVLMVTITCLVLARIVAETGIPVMGNSLGVMHILDMLPIGWLNAKAIYLTSSVDLVIGPDGSRVSAAVAAMHGFGLDKERGPRRHARLAMGFLGVLLVGLVFAGIVHLWLGYSYPKSLDGKTAIGLPNAIQQTMHNPLKAFARESWGNAPYSRLGHTIFGMLLGIGLQIACLLSPLWPLHPIGLLIMSGHRGGFILHIWPSILFGWAIKRAILLYGGARAYRTARPLFLGLILGEVFSAILWSVVPAVLVWMGGDAAEIGHINITIPQ